MHKLALGDVRARVTERASEEASPAQQAAEALAAYYNRRLVLYLVYIWVAIVGIALVHRLLRLYVAHVRRIACLATERQMYFALPESTYAKIKRYLLDAPLFRHRHNREFMLSSAVGAGTLPTRLQALLIGTYYAVNITFLLILLPYGTANFFGFFMLRAGNLAVLNMIPLFLMAGRNNILILALDISFDSYNVLHRWLGRLAVLEAITHACAWTVNTVQKRGGWSVVWKAASESQLILTGTIAVCCFAFLLVHSPSMIRHAYYETFLHAHILVAATAVAVLWLHLSKIPSARMMLLAATVLWGFERFMRFQNLVRNNIGAGGTRAEVEAMPGDAMRITLHLARPWKFRPGQHVFLYIPAIGWWTNHPFSLAWSEEDVAGYGEKGFTLDQQDVLSMRKTTMSLIIRRRTGFTDRLWNRAEKSINVRFVTKAFVEGPYGHQDLSSYGTVILFAAGVGITHQVPFLRSLLADHANSTGAVRRVTLVWIIQSVEHLEWIRPWMEDILGMENRREVLRILLFITRPRSMQDIHSPSASVQMFPGKPGIDAILAQQQEKQVGAMAVSVCGTGSLSDDVRCACRTRCQKTTIDFIENAFSW